MLRLVRSHASELIDSLAELGGRDISVFGSVARGEDGPDSDVDLLVDLDESVGLFRLLEMRAVAEQILGRKVDVIPRRDLKAEVLEAALLDEYRL
ncbi:nucleotidyltransferase family protein [Brevibacterium marinum]|nr:nucleotidyltransferase domain-containing protein [Brevibacterium marinum]